MEVAIEDAKQVFATGQARNRAARAVGRTIPFQLACQAVTVTWYATACHHPADVDAHRASAPWYTSKAQPSTADIMLTSSSSRSALVSLRCRRCCSDGGRTVQLTDA